MNTEFTDGENSFQVIDFMPRYPREDGSYYAPPDVVRFIRLISGKPKFRIKYDPRLDFSREKTYNDHKGNYIKSYTKEGKYDSLFFYSSLDLNDILEQNKIELTGNAYCLVGYHEKLITQSLDRSYLKFQRTKTYWMNWSAKTTRYTHYENEIMRSALVLKCLSYKNLGQF